LDLAFERRCTAGKSGNYDRRNRLKKTDPSKLTHLKTATLTFYFEIPSFTTFLHGPDTKNSSLSRFLPNHKVPMAKLRFIASSQNGAQDGLLASKKSNETVTPEDEAFEITRAIHP
jgi:hypothetical protein